VTPRPGHAPSLEELASHCRERLAGYKVPRAYYFVGSLPRGPSSKLLRRELVAPQSVRARLAERK
jgi:fatty-acyl-CoA synthase